MTSTNLKSRSKNLIGRYSGGSTSAKKVSGPCGFAVRSKVQVEGGKWVSYYQLQKDIDAGFQFFMAGRGRG